MAYKVKLEWSDNNTVRERTSIIKNRFDTVEDADYYVQAQLDMKRLNCGNELLYYIIDEDTDKMVYCAALCS